MNYEIKADHSTNHPPIVADMIGLSLRGEPPFLFLLINGKVKRGEVKESCVLKN